MPSRVTPLRPITQNLGDAAIASLAWASASAGIVLGGRPLWVALVALATPMVAFVAFGHLAGRGPVIACVASALGVGMASGSGGSAAWGAVGLIGLIDVVAFAGGLSADRMAPVRAVAPSAGEGGTWMTIVVHQEAAPVVASGPRTSAPMDRTRRTPRQAASAFPARTDGLESGPRRDSLFSLAPHPKGAWGECTKHSAVDRFRGLSQT